MFDLPKKDRYSTSAIFQKLSAPWTCSFISDELRPDTKTLSSMSEHQRGGRPHAHQRSPHKNEPPLVLLLYMPCERREHNRTTRYHLGRIGSTMTQSRALRAKTVAHRDNFKSLVKVAPHGVRLHDQRGDDFVRLNTAFRDQLVVNLESHVRLVCLDARLGYMSKQKKMMIQLYLDTGGRDSESKCGRTREKKHSSSIHSSTRSRNEDV